MKKTDLLRTFALLSTSSLLLMACNNTEEEPVEPETEQPEETEEPDENGEATEDSTEVSQNVEDWFPIIEDTYYVYEGESEESPYTDFSIYPQYTEDNMMQVSWIHSEAPSSIVYEYSEDEIRQIYTRDDAFYRENFITPWNPDYRDEEIDIILQAPIETGHSWESPNGASYEIVDTNAEVETPTGTYETIEVVRQSDTDGAEIQETFYYAEGVGLVQRHFQSDEAEILSQLTEIQEDVPESIFITYYNLDDNAMEIESHDSELELSTNETPREALADALSGNVPEYETIFLLPEGTEINHLFYDSEAGVVNVDFSEELITDLQAGSGTESLVLQSIVNTIGSYYGADEVLLTVEGQPYESGHMAMSEGETWPVDY